MNKVQLTIGSDPEMMLFSRKEGRVVSAIPILKQGKENKIKLGGGREVYYDNVNLETTVVPRASQKGFVNSVGKSLAGIANYIGKDFKLLAQASHNFDLDQLEHPDARAFGCSKEYDAYGLCEVTPPAAPESFRSAGGHIHVGRNDFKSIEDIEGVALLDPWSKLNGIKMMDIFVGLSIAIMDNDPTSPARKALYGNAGRHRIPPYGFEYRTPSNYWLNSPYLTGLVYDLTNFAVSHVLNDKVEEVLAKINQDAIIEAVNTNNKDLAAQLLEKVEMPARLRKAVFEHAKVQYNDLYQAWSLAA